MREASVIDKKIDSGRLLLWFDRVSRWLLAGVFLAASGPKIFAPAAFAEIIGAYGLLPEFLLLPAGFGISLGEVITAAALLMARREGLQGAALFLICFIGVLSYGIYLGLDIDCGCFGPEDPEHSAFGGLRFALLRDVLLLIPLCFSFWYKYLNTSDYWRN